VVTCYCLVISKKILDLGKEWASEYSPWRLAAIRPVLGAGGPECDFNVDRYILFPNGG